MTGRIEALRSGLEEPLLVTDLVNVRYLTGFESSNAAVLVEHDRVRLFTDGRYSGAAREIQGVEVVETRRDTIGHLAEILEGRVGFEADQLPYGYWQRLSAGGAELVPRRGLVEALRAVKDAEELSAIKRAGELITTVYERLAQEQFVGRTERALAWRIVQLTHEVGSAPAFEPIVAAGANGSRPHAEPGERLIETGQLVVVDAGALVDGYASDCTRTFSTGSIPDELTRAYEVCLAAQLAGLAAIRPGVSGIDADRAARAVIEEAGLGESFGHGLGHGTGLAVHEVPRLSTESQDVLETGNVVTVEPGIYLDGLGGVRIEDLVVVRDDGAEVLTAYTKELVTVR